MSWLRFLRRNRWDDERARELAAHLQIEIDEGIARGLTPDHARVEAHRRLGNITLVREEIFRMNSLQRLETIWQDVRYAARLLRKAPGFTFVAILSLMLGIGANTAIFQLLDAVRLRTLPVPHADELVEVKVVNAVNGRTGNFSSRHPTITNAQWERIRDGQHVFSSTLAWSSTQFDLADAGESKPAQGLWVSGAFFETLGLRPQAGRLLAPADDVRGCGATSAVLSDAFWHRQYGGDASVVGRTLHLGGHVVQIAGVAPANFFGIEVGHPFDVALPICAEPMFDGADNLLDHADAWWLGVLGRLKPGVTTDLASKSLAEMSPAIFKSTIPPRFNADDVKDYVGFQFGALPAATGVSDLRDQYQQPLSVLLAIAGLVLLIACGNIANLLIARASAREREVAVRMAIGASRTRLIRQLMVESLLLAGAGSLLGAWLAGQTSRALVAFMSTSSAPLAFDLGIDWHVYAFAMAAGTITCVAFGLAPAFRATRTQPNAVLRSSGRGMTDSRERFGMRRVLVVSQMALSLVLLVGALLFTRTFWNLSHLDPGFRMSGIFVGSIDDTRANVPPADRLRVEQAFATALAAVHGVDGAASAAVIPLEGSGRNDRLVIDGVPRKPYPSINRVGSDFFRLMGIPLRSGRGFNDYDTPASPQVAVVSEAFSRVFLNGANPIGRTFTFPSRPDRPQPLYQIVGVVGDTKYRDLHDPIKTIIYFPEAQDPAPEQFSNIMLRTNPNGPSLTTAIVDAVRKVSPTALVSIRRLDAFASESIVTEQLMATLSGFFALLAGMLAAIGLYGVMSYGVTRRRSEIGIRMALGADAIAVFRLVLREAAMLVAIGLAIGGVMAFFAAKAAASLLFNLKPTDVPSLASAASLLVAISAAAAAVPAYRATRVQPTEALRGE